MAAFNRIFSRPETLRTISSARLARLLEPHGPSLLTCGFTVPRGGKDMDYERLSHVLMSPDETRSLLPEDLIDALYILADFATADAMYLLLAAAERKSISITRADDQAPIDVAVDAWLVNQDFVKEVHLELYTQRPRSFQYLPRIIAQADHTAPSADALRQSKPTLDKCFASHNLGGGSSVTPYDRGGFIQFLVRRGDPIGRFGAMDKQKASSKVFVFRPEQFDLVVFDKSVGDLRMNVDAVWLTELYRQCFGELLFGTKDAFGKSAKFTLDPIRTLGRECLNCDDIPGIEWIKLREIKLLIPGGGHDIIARPDVFAYYEATRRTIPTNPKIAKAIFEVKFNDSAKPIRVTIHVPNRTSCLRDSHAALIDKWLELRTFVVDNAQPTIRENIEADEILVNAGVAAGILDKLSRMDIPSRPGTAIDRPAAATNGNAGNRAPVTGTTSE